jgi:multisubunit Na+/H+ antiporter MnhG subunit
MREIFEFEVLVGVALTFLAAVALVAYARAWTAEKQATLVGAPALLASVAMVTLARQDSWPQWVTPTIWGVGLGAAILIGASLLSFVARLADKTE